MLCFKFNLKAFNILLIIYITISHSLFENVWFCIELGKLNMYFRQLVGCGLKLKL